MTPRYKHVISRALERYGLELSPQDIDNISLFAGDIAKERQKVAVPYEGRWMACVYAPECGIVTVLPPSEIRPKMRRRTEKVLKKLGLK